MPARVLVIAYFFPPTGGAGVQRTAKFVKYLPAQGWQPVVLTVSNPSVPVFDETLLREIPADVEVVRARTFEPDYRVKNAVSASASVGNGTGNGGFKAWFRKTLRGAGNLVLQPDPQSLWLPAAWRAGKRLLQAKPVDVIFVTAPPFSSLLLGARLSRHFGVPLVVDFRDEWDISNAVWENRLSGRFGAWLQGRMQRYVLESATAVVATTTMSADNLGDKLRALGRPGTAHCIYNGFDPDDFAATQVPGVHERFQLTYVGTLWNLTSVEPVVAALLKLQETQPDLAGRIRLSVAGRCTAEQRDMLRRLEGSAVELVVHDYLSHPEALALLAAADSLCLLLGDYPFAGRVVPAKTFEYLASGKQILAVAPEGEVWRILAEFPQARCVAPADIEAIAAAIANQVRDFDQQSQPQADPGLIARYSRPELTRQLAAVFTAHQRGPDPR